MARMIPPLIPPDCAPGERIVFERLASDPQADGWIVLHSLELARHVRQVQGEADFVVIIPGAGVAVIEVKSHLSVKRFENGQWVLGKGRPTSRSPFQQASEAMHSIRHYLRQKRLDLDGIPFVSGVWFTHVKVRNSMPVTPEWHEWQLLDRDDIASGSASSVLRLLTDGADHLRSRVAGFREHRSGPDQGSVDAIVHALRPRFELAAGSADLRRDRESQLSAFLDEQYEALDAMQSHRRVLFTGPAGCGKTFLALESARREAVTGRTGWLICFNRALSRYLRSRGDAPGLSVTGLHQLLLRITGMQVPNGAGESFWNGTLVDQALEQLIEGAFTRDYIIVDEIQDIASAAYLDVLDLLVHGGLPGGRCLLFGDFERQAVYGKEDGRDHLSNRIPDLVRYSLTSNCRNLPRIGRAAETIASMQPGYRRFRRTDDGTMPRYVWYTHPEQQEPLLVGVVRDFLGEGFRAEDIAILSPRSSGSTAARCEEPWLRNMLVAADGTPPPRGRIRHSTIHSFKGLEAPAIILTDIDDVAAPEFEALLYVGLTRPTERLTVLATKAALGGKIIDAGR